MRQYVLGIAVDNLSMQETLERIESFVASGRPHQHVVVNADKVVKAHRDPQLARIIAACDLSNADGMPVVWASHLMGQPLKERVTGIDLFFRLLRRAQEKGWRVYFLGAKQEVVDEVVRRARTDYPALQIAGHHDGYWAAQEEEHVVRSIGATRPDLLFVAISSPKKEEFLARHQARMRIPFAMGVGGTFDVMVGLTRRAPLWMQKTGFEWLYRFLQEPRRMFKRYFVDDMAFFWILSKAYAGRLRARFSTTAR